ncbi:hypothetical protein L596_027321 [Steinernema carpocapsae]|uniref:Activin types I and II receptor domain-containing protein n=1 Tax=Steinernema carpocapsae TaxID=34508 RepID=A0A4U5M3Z9_STECR|nr:hypothetical protein L596_027321 [Steinernema carpocapsae]
MRAGLLACTFMAILSVPLAIKCYNGSYYEEYHSRPVGKTNCLNAKFCFRQSGEHNQRIGWLHGCGEDVLCTKVVSNMEVLYTEGQRKMKRDCCNTDFCNNVPVKSANGLGSAVAVAFVLLLY